MYCGLFAISKYFGSFWYIFLLRVCTYVCIEIFITWNIWLTLDASCWLFFLQFELASPLRHRVMPSAEVDEWSKIWHKNTVASQECRKRQLEVNYAETTEGLTLNPLPTRLASIVQISQTPLPYDIIYAGE